MAYDANGNWTDEEDSSVKKLNEITASDSPYIQQAKQSGMETAGRRGLLNSSISAGSSQGAAIAAAQPLAIADSNTAAQKNISAQNAAQAKTLQTQQLASQEKIASENLSSNERIAALDADTQRQINSMKVAADQQAAAQNAAVQYANVYANQVASINQNPNIPASERASLLQSAQNQFNANLGLVEQFYNIQLSWSSAF